ncbi:MAG: hypothetical protein U0531_22440 [Dehalococcoidia bacterium]
MRWDYERIEAGAGLKVTLDVRLPSDRPVGAASRWACKRSPPRRRTPADNAAEWSTRLVPGPAASLAVTPGQPDIVACALGRTILAAAVRDAADRPVLDGTRVAWQATAGRLDRAESVTAAGVATATLVGAPPLGPATVTARVGPVVGQATLALIAGPPAGLALGAAPDRVAAGGSTELVAQAIDGCGNPVADGWPVTFTAERGAFPGGGASAVTATIGGVARARLSVGAALGRLVVTADQRSVHAQTAIDVVPPPAPPRFALWLPYSVRPRAVVRAVR